MHGHCAFHGAVGETTNSSAQPEFESKNFDEILYSSQKQPLSSLLSAGADVLRN